MNKNINRTSRILNIIKNPSISTDFVVILQNVKIFLQEK